MFVFVNSREKLNVIMQKIYAHTDASTWAGKTFFKKKKHQTGCYETLGKGSLPA